MPKSTSLRRFVTYTWFLLAYLLGVILWGAYVRVTGSGAGCGNHWPLCNGEVIPRSPDVETIIEFVHRLSSGIGFLLVIVLLVWAFRLFPKSSLVRTFAGLTMFFMVTEALVGAGLVLFGLVADDDSFARAWVMAFHLVNTFLLLGCLSLAGWYASGKPRPNLTGRDPLKWILLSGALALLLLGASGAVAALGDTLFPSDNIAEALQEDFSPGAHVLIRLRVYHPLLSLLVGVLILAISAYVMKTKRDYRTRVLALATSLLYLFQQGVGLFNLLLLAPAWLQLTHLFFSDVIWISFVLLSASVLSGEVTERYGLGESGEGVTK